MTMPHLMNCEHQDSGWCLGCVKQQYDELHEAQSQVAGLREVLESCKYVLTESLHTGQVHCETLRTKVEVEQALSAPAVAMVPWEVVKKTMDAEFAVNFAYAYELDAALKRRDTARAKLQSYAPSQPKEKE